MNTYKTMRKLLQRLEDTIIIMKYDKGNKTVVMHKESYKYFNAKALRGQKSIYKNKIIIMDLFKQQYII